MMWSGTQFCQIFMTLFLTGTTINTSLKLTRDHTAIERESDIRLEMEKLLSSLTEVEIDELTEKIHLKLLAEPIEEIGDSVVSRTRREELSVPISGSLGNRQKQFLIKEAYGGHEQLTGDVSTKTSHPTKYRRDIDMDTQKMYNKLTAVTKTSAEEKSNQRSKRAIYVNWQMVKEILGWQKRKNKPELVYLTAKTAKKEH